MSGQKKSALPKGSSNASLHKTKQSPAKTTELTANQQPNLLARTPDAINVEIERVQADKNLSTEDKRNQVAALQGAYAQAIIRQEMQKKVAHLPAEKQLPALAKMGSALVALLYEEAGLDTREEEYEHVSEHEAPSEHEASSEDGILHLYAVAQHPANTKPLKEGATLEEPAQPQNESGFWARLGWGN